MRLARPALALLISAAVLPGAAAGADKPVLQVATRPPAASTRFRLRLPQFPSDVKSRGDKLWLLASPALKAWTLQNAHGLEQSTTDPATLSLAAARARWPGARPATHDVASFVLLYQSAKELQDKIKSQLDSLSEMGEMESLRLQMAMDRLSKMMSTLSNLLKKLSDTADSIVQNLK